MARQMSQPRSTAILLLLLVAGIAQAEDVKSSAFQSLRQGTPAQTRSGQQPPTPATNVVIHSSAGSQAQQSGSKRSLLSLQGGPADAFNKATHAHHSTKEAHTPSKTNPTQPLTNSKGLEAGAAHRPAHSSTTSTPRLQESAVKETLIKLPKASHQPNSASSSRPTQTSSQRNLLSTQNGPADAFNKAAKRHKSNSAAILKPQHTNAAKQHAVRRVMPSKPLATHNPKLPESLAPQVAPAGQKIVTTIPITTISSTAGSHRSLLGGPADAFNKATHAHHGTKEATIPSKTSPLIKPQEVPSTAQRNLLSLQGGPADAFNKATHARKQTKEAARPSKTNPTQPLTNSKGLEAGSAQPVDRTSNTNALRLSSNPAAPNKPLIRPQEAAKVLNKKQPAAINTPKATSPVAPGAPKDAARNLLQWGGWGGGGWSGSQSQAQAQAQSQGWGGGGFGGWGGSGSQAQAQAQSQSQSGGFGGFGGSGYWGRKLKGAASQEPTALL